MRNLTTLRRQTDHDVGSVTLFQNCKFNRIAPNKTGRWSRWESVWKEATVVQYNSISLSKHFIQQQK
jgi:hypothetical protein